MRNITDHVDGYLDVQYNQCKYYDHTRLTTSDTSRWFSWPKVWIQNFPVFPSKSPKDDVVDSQGIRRRRLIWLLRESMIRIMNKSLVSRNWQRIYKPVYGSYESFYLPAHSNNAQIQAIVNHGEPFSDHLSHNLVLCAQYSLQMSIHIEESMIKQVI
jgi:hypothetical protein